ncbi:MAG: ornithine carbamoyltransferase [Candidatus Diapherotrites archaeon]
MKPELALYDEIDRILETKEMRKLNGKDFIQFDDVNAHQIFMLFQIAERMKTLHAQKKPLPPLLKQKTIALLFEKPSTRTRVSFDVGINLLGGHSVFIDKQSTQMGRGEDWKDTAHTLSQYTDAIMGRVFEHKELELMADYSPHPVINGLTNEDHPCQTLSDLYTIHEHYKGYHNITVMYAGVANNVSNSLMVGCGMVGINMDIVSPKPFPVSQKYYRLAKKYSKKTNVEIRTFTSMPDKKTLKNVNIVYTDEWESMHMKLDKKKILPLLKPLQVNDKLLNQCARNVNAMHCLPAKKGEEITENVIYGKRSLIWKQAQNRMWTQMALMSTLLK